MLELAVHVGVPKLHIAVLIRAGESIGVKAVGHLDRENCRITDLGVC